MAARKAVAIVCEHHVVWKLLTWRRLARAKIALVCLFVRLFVRLTRWLVAALAEA